MSYKHTHVYTQVAKLREACYRNHMKIRPHSQKFLTKYILSLKCAHLVAMRSEKLTIMKAVAFENLNQFVNTVSAFCNNQEQSLHVILVFSHRHGSLIDHSEYWSQLILIFVKSSGHMAWLVLVSSGL